MITLTTDFGSQSPYVAAMKGVILSINPAARLVDLTHEVPPQDLRHTAYFLAAALPYFPPTALHIVVVDPGVGSSRAILHVCVAGQQLLVPDNGCWTSLVREGQPPPLVRRVTESRFYRPAVSATFHGRDIFAPVAAHLSLGADPAELGPRVDEWVKLEPLPFNVEPGRVCGSVQFIDDFGNAITNIPAEVVPATSAPRFLVGEHSVSRVVRAYADAKRGEPVALVSSNGLWEIAVRQGSAAMQLGIRVGMPVCALMTDDHGT